MQLCVLASPDSWYVTDLDRAAVGRHQVVPASFRQLASLIEPSGLRAGSGGTDLTGCDCILVRTMPLGSLEQIVFRMDVLGRLESQGVLVVNPTRSLETAVDKYLALAKLQAAGLNVPRTLVCQTFDDALGGFGQLGGDVVVKPLFGSEGRGMMRIMEKAMAERVFRTLVQLQAVIYLQQFIHHDGYDLRMFVVGDRVLGMKRTSHLDWRTNVACGAVTEPVDPSEEMAATARRAAAAVGAHLAGVDLLPGRDGRVYVLEVNAVPGWKALSVTLHTDVAGLVLDFLETRVASAS